MHLNSSQVETFTTYSYMANKDVVKFFFCKHWHHVLFWDQKIFPSSGLHLMELWTLDLVSTCNWGAGIADVLSYVAVFHWITWRFCLIICAIAMNNNEPPNSTFTHNKRYIDRHLHWFVNWYLDYEQYHKTYGKASVPKDPLCGSLEYLHIV